MVLFDPTKKLELEPDRYTIRSTADLNAWHRDHPEDTIALLHINTLSRGTFDSQLEPHEMYLGMLAALGMEPSQEDQAWLQDRGIPYPRTET